MGYARAIRLVGAFATMAIAALPASARDLGWQIKDTAVATAGEALVVGNVHYLEDGAEKKCTSGYDCELVLLAPGTDRATAYTFKRTGPFSWSLPPGDYLVIALIRYDGGWNMIPLRGKFTVPPAAAAVYIGEIYLAKQNHRYLGAVADAFAKAQAEFAATHPAQPGTLANATLDQEPLPPDPARYRPICAEDWKLPCGKNSTGVVPTLPGTGKGYPTTADLRPRFAWSPSTDPAVTYDLALYEVATVNGGMMLHKQQSLQGRLVAYREGLTRPEWQPDEPLPPGHRYLWSVRLRRGDLASGWSSYSYFNFFLIGFSSGFGNWFGFSTPATGK